MGAGVWFPTTVPVVGVGAENFCPTEQATVPARRTKKLISIIVRMVPTK